jgi:hypothetical protein
MGSPLSPLADSGSRITMLPPFVVTALSISEPAPMPRTLLTVRLFLGRPSLLLGFSYKALLAAFAASAARIRLPVSSRFALNLRAVVPGEQGLANSIDKRVLKPRPA